MFKLIPIQYEHLIEKQDECIIVKYKNHLIKRRKNKIQSIKEECSDGYVNWTIY